MGAPAAYSKLMVLESAVVVPFEVDGKIHSQQDGIGFGVMEIIRAHSRLAHGERRQIRQSRNLDRLN